MWKRQMKVLTKVVVGSRLHGLNTETSDWDYRGIHIHPLQDALSPFKKLKNTDWIEGDEDNTSYELADFCKNAPKWVIAENVRGLLTMQQGLVFEQVCSDLEDQGYEVQPFVIPAVALNAPHRRDRIWFVAHSLDHRPREEKPRGDGEETGVPQVDRSEHSPTRESIGTDSQRRGQGYAADSNLGESRPRNESESAKPQQPERSADNRDLASNPNSQYEERLEPTGTGPGQPEAETSDRDRNAQDARGVGSGGRSDGDSSGHDREIQDARSSSSRLGWERNWLQVATEFCSVDDGLPVELDGFKLTKPQHRAEQLKAYGNAIVPQIAIQIMKGMVL